MRAHKRGRRGESVHNKGRERERERERERGREGERENKLSEIQAV